MFHEKDLKPERCLTETEVECPVLGCQNKVKRRRDNEKVEKTEFLCDGKGHKHTPIYITPSTFVYKDWTENFLWRGGDLSELDQIHVHKADGGARLGHENSEDAFTWNAFKYLEKSGLFGKYLEIETGKQVDSPELFYWGLDKDGKVWDPLAKARECFEPNQRNRTEPDLIVYTSDALFFFESKLGSTSRRSKVSTVDEEKYRRYREAGDGWSDKVLRYGVDRKAFTEEYQLFRHWLLGTWIADRVLGGIKFYLIRLAPDTGLVHFYDSFGMYLNGGGRHLFTRAVWEQLYHFLKENNAENTILSYFEGKTLGYSGSTNQRIRHAFPL